MPDTLHPHRWPDNPLFVCPGCLRIGPHGSAMEHERETGHRTMRLSDAQASAQRGRWDREGRCWQCGSSDHRQAACPEIT